MNVKEILKAAQALVPEDRIMVARALREPHKLETDWNTSADNILEAIHRSNDLTQRGVRGIITELEFRDRVIPTLTGWAAQEIIGDTPVDFLLGDSAGTVSVQVKMQRKKAQVALVGASHRKTWPAGKYVVEVQRTRGGKKNGVDTRPYLFGDFDILAVSLQPATRDWSKFMYTVARWLIPRPKKRQRIAVFQPVAPASDDFWTDDFRTCVKWLRSGMKKTIDYPSVPRVRKSGELF